MSPVGLNSGYTIMENTIVSVYNAEALARDLLEQLMDPFENTDCDSCGSRGLISKDGFDVEEIICRIMKPEKCQAVLKKPEWFEGEEPGTEYHHHWRSSAAGNALFRSIWRGHWGIFTRRDNRK